jgi:hypothetical protein
MGHGPGAAAAAAAAARSGGDRSAGCVLAGIDANDHSGRAVSAAGDVNGDGIADGLVGARDAERTSGSGGESYVVFGRDSSAVGNFPPLIALASLLPEHGGDGSRGVVLEDIDVRGHAGAALGDAGDVNDDGIADIVIGASHGRARRQRLRRPGIRGVRSRATVAAPSRTGFAARARGK